MSKAENYRRIFMIYLRYFRSRQSRINLARVQLVLLLLAIPMGELWFLLGVTFPNENWLPYVVGGLSGVLFVSIYRGILCRVQQGRWLWFAN